MTKIGIYRTAENEFLDLRKQDTADWLRAHYPAIMADRPVGMSENYQFMPSHRIAQNLTEKFGMGLVEVGQQFSRQRNPAGQEHFMKFRLPSNLATLRKVGDSVPELVIMNSHNGRSTIRAYAGVFRLVCANGMVVSERSFGQIKLRHFGADNTFPEFNKVLNLMAHNMTVLDDRMAKMKEVMLTPHQQNSLARELMKIRKVPNWVEPSLLLEANRPEDQREEDGKRNLWLTYNVLQENLTNRSISREFEEQRNRSLRPLSGARAQILTNERLWAGLEAYISSNFKKLAHEAFEPIEGTAVDVTPETAPVTKLRGFDELMAQGSYADWSVTDEEAAQLDKDQKAKLAKRKSYLKSKETVTA